ncbi:hypothetical protein PR048_014268 [Dryococelus australis]|uniref:CCHC-type domain-containing protein n=1 Tax=Dryococelus australis TaxID=614101 RepID=A0ABQ9HDY6_9NEOP|nr:hypothetical protein PR048_014268 [Dryococelus australis]
MENTTSATLNHPPKLSLEGNMHENWIRFECHFLVYIGASGKYLDVPADATAEEKKKIFRMKARTLLNAFDNYAAPKRNETYERYVFNQCNQREGETFNHFLTKSKKLIKSCGCGDQEDSILRDCIVISIQDCKLREVLLRAEDLKLDQAIRECWAAERSKLYSKKFQDTEDESVPVDVMCAGNVAEHIRTECAWHTEKNCLNCQVKGHLVKQCPKLKHQAHVNELTENVSDSDVADSFYCDHIRVDTLESAY